MSQLDLKLDRMFMGFNPESKLWIFSSKVELSEDNKDTINKSLEDFIANWQAHGISLTSGFHIFNNHFILVSVDKNSEAASGCSIDKLVGCIKRIESVTGLSLIDRMWIPSIENDKIVPLSLRDFNKKIKDSTHFTYYDTSISTLDELRNGFLVKNN